MRAAIAALAPRHARTSGQGTDQSAKASPRANDAGSLAAAAGTPGGAGGQSQLQRYKTYLEQSQAEIERLQEQLVAASSGATHQAAAQQQRTHDLLAEVQHLRSQVAVASEGKAAAEARAAGAAEELATHKAAVASSAREHARQVRTRAMVGPHSSPPPPF